MGKNLSGSDAQRCLRITTDTELDRSLQCHVGKMSSLDLPALNHHGKEQENHRDPLSAPWLQLGDCSLFWHHISGFLFTSENQFTEKAARRTEDLKN